LFKEIINKHSDEGNVVLDTFAGVGTTAVACKELNREYILIERDPEYVKMIQERLNG